MKKLILLLTLPLWSQTIQLNPGQSVQLNAPAVTWSVTPQVGSVSATGLYSAPQTNPSQQTVVVNASAGGQTILTQNITLLPDAIQITLPIEVGGADGSIVIVPFNIPATANLSGPLTLALRTHNLKYETEASVKINNGTWTPLNTSTLTLGGMATSYGGIGGGFKTLRFTLPLPGTIAPGLNTVSFRFNGTNGFTSEFRVLEFNIQNGGVALLPPSVFVWDEPAKWAPPLNNPADIAIGKTLFQTQQLRGSGMAGLIKAHCSDCHTQDGRDLKYFNYDNKSIVDRSVFHGLTVQQGNQIASYIRTIPNIPECPSARPWNPPYQPGVALATVATSCWAVGTGIDGVLDDDSQVAAFLAPGGNTSGWVATGNINPQNIPTALQLPDWNSWLPTIHPMDAFGATFTGNVLATNYTAISSGLVANNAASYAKWKSLIFLWNLYLYNFSVANKPAYTSPTWNAALGAQWYSVVQWSLVKNFEINQQFGLESMITTAFPHPDTTRGWYTKIPFFVSPNAIQIPVTGVLDNGSWATRTYLSYIWYYLQLILNAGNGQLTGNSPIDFPYVYNFVQGVSMPAAKENGPLIYPLITNGNLMQEWLIKALQEETWSASAINLNTTPALGSTGWAPSYSNPMNLLSYPRYLLFAGMSSTDRTTYLTGYTQAWFAQISTYTQAQFIAGNWASAGEDPGKDNPALPQQFGGNVWQMLPRLRYYGVNAALTTKIAAWAATVWPAGNWAANNSATCKIPQFQYLTCTSDGL